MEMLRKCYGGGSGVTIGKLWWRWRGRYCSIMVAVDASDGRRRWHQYREIEDCSGCKTEVVADVDGGGCGGGGCGGGGRGGGGRCWQW